MCDLTCASPVRVAATMVVLVMLLLTSACEHGAGEKVMETTGPIASNSPAEPVSETTAPTPPAEQAPQPSADAPAAATLTYRIIDAPGGTFGYDIMSDGQLFIHQANVPGRPGMEGCRTREQAASLAELVVNKIKEGHMPPAVSDEELNTLNIR